MTWTRRGFINTLGLTVAGGIFVPKYERWFRPNRIVPLPGIASTFGGALKRMGSIEIFTGDYASETGTLLARIPFDMDKKQARRLNATVDNTGRMGWVRAVPSPGLTIQGPQ